jgi:hypothetical protein
VHRLEAIERARFTTLSFRDAPSVGNCRPEATGPESILPVVAMDSGLALRAPRNDGGNCVEHHLTRLVLYLGKIRHRARRGTDFVQELQAIFAHFWIVVVDHDACFLAEERINRTSKG